MKNMTSITLSIIMASVVGSSMAIAQPCPPGLKHEKSDIFYSGPRGRIAKGNIVSARTCVSTTLLVHAQQQSHGKSCPSGYSKEKAQILYPSPRKRLLGYSTQETELFCVATVKPNSGALGVSRPPITFAHELRDAVLTGEAGQKITTTSALACKRSCSTLAFCSGWSWIPSNKACTLTRYANKLSFAPNAISGWSTYRHNRHQSYFKRDINDILNNEKLFSIQKGQGGIRKNISELDTSTTADREACARRCLINHPVICGAFEYNDANRSCKRYKSGASYFDADVSSPNWIGIRRTAGNPNPPKRSTKASRSSGDKA